MHGSAQVEASRRAMHPRLELDGPGELREVDGRGPGTAGGVGVQAPDRGARELEAYGVFAGNLHKHVDDIKELMKMHPRKGMDFIRRQVMKLRRKGHRDWRKHALRVIISVVVTQGRRENAEMNWPRGCVDL